jgi:hypothetical protein
VTATAVKSTDARSSTTANENPASAEQTAEMVKQKTEDAASDVNQTVTALVTNYPEIESQTITDDRANALLEDLRLLKHDHLNHGEFSSLKEKAISGSVDQAITELQAAGQNGPESASHRVNALKRMKDVKIAVLNP